MTTGSKQDIIDEVEKSFTAFAGMITGLDEKNFMLVPTGKWTAGQHLDHLIRSGKPVLMALKLPRFIIKMLFGKPKRTGRNYEELVNKYHAKLDEGYKATGPYIPPAAVPYSLKAAKLDSFNSLKEKLKKKISSIPDEELDQYLLPHPLLGKLSFREMLFFTVYHNYHHLHNHLKDKQQLVTM